MAFLEKILLFQFFRQNNFLKIISEEELSDNEENEKKNYDDAEDSGNGESWKSITSKSNQDKYSYSQCSAWTKTTSAAYLI